MHAFIRVWCYGAVVLLIAGCMSRIGAAEKERKGSSAADAAAEEQTQAEAEAVKAQAEAAAAAARAEHETEVDAELVGVANDLARIKASAEADAPAALQLALGDLGRLMDLFDKTPELLLKKNIKEMNLRLCEATIQLTRRMAHPPDVPEEARREVAFGMTALKRAQDDAGVHEAALHFQEALRRAPWVAGIWYNFAAVLEKLEAYDDATASLRFYLLADPQAADANAVQNKIYELEYLAKEKARRERWLGTWASVGRPLFSTLTDSYFWKRERSETKDPMTFRVYVTEVSSKGEVRARIGFIQWGFDEAYARKYAKYLNKTSLGKEVPFAFGGPKAEWTGQLTDHGLLLSWPLKTETIGNGEGMGTIDAKIEITEQDGVVRMDLKATRRVKFAAGYYSDTEQNYAAEIRKEEPAARPSVAEKSPEAAPAAPALRRYRQ